MNRRNVLVGLGGLVAGGGLLIGTGAFTTVEAERTVSIETAGDADAFLGLEVDDAYDVGDDIVQIALGGGSEADGSGLNHDALTTWEPMLVVSNNGTQDVESIAFEFETGDDDPDVVDIDDVDDNEIGMAFDFHSDFGGADGFDTNGTVDEEPTGANPLSSGDAAAYDLRVDTRGSDLEAEDSFDVTVTISVEAGE